MNDLFRQIDRLVHLPVSDRDALSQLFVPRSLTKNTFWVRAGDSTRHVAFVRSGALRAFFTSPSGVDYNKTFFVENDIFGVYYALLLNRPSHLSVQALTDCQLLVANFDALQALYDQHPMLERLARRQAENLFLIKEQREIDLVMLDAKARYARFQHQYPTLEQRVSQYHIASHLGITPTQLSRIRAAI